MKSTPQFQVYLQVPKGRSAEIMAEVLTLVNSDHQSSDKESTGSLYSHISTRDVTAFVKELYGRKFNKSNEAYVLPCDNIEFDRLDKQQSVYMIALNGLYPCPEVVEALLAPKGNAPKRILDIGCGTGYWSNEMASRFTHCQVMGIDLVPVPMDPSIIPKNLRFQCNDINNGLSHLYGQFDVVHSRCIMTGIKDPDKSIEEFVKCLKPGGLLLMIEGDKEFLDKDHELVQMAKLEGDEEVNGVSENGSWFQRMIWEAHEASKNSGSAVERAVEMIDHGLWDQPLCDPETAVASSIFLPIGPWPKSSDFGGHPAVKYAGILMRQNFQKVHRAYHGILQKHGLSEETINEWSRRTEEELISMKPKMWTRIRVCWARRREAEELAAPALPPLPPGPPVQPPSQIASLLLQPYPAVELYKTREQAVAARKKRMDTMGVWPTSAVMRAARARDEAARNA